MTPCARVGGSKPRQRPRQTKALQEVSVVGMQRARGLGTLFISYTLELGIINEKINH